MKDLDWVGSDYLDQTDLAAKIEWEGGLAEFVCVYGPGVLPEPLATAAANLKDAYIRCEKVFREYEAI